MEFIDLKKMSSSYTMSRTLQVAVELEIFDMLTSEHALLDFPASAGFGVVVGCK